MITRRNTQNWLPDVFNDFFNTDYLPKVNVTAPAINVIERPNEYDVEVAAPGMTKDDFKVSLDEDENLVIALEKEEKKEQNDNDAHYLRREFSYTQYHQALILPDDVDKEKISASVNNGVLTVILPKVTQEELQKQAKVIAIQ